jgi:adenylate cyclase class 2
MKEVEVKYKVLGKSFIDCIKTVEKQSGITFSEPIIQDDASYSPEGFDFKNVRTVSNTAFLRLRKQNNELIFTLKKPINSLLDKIEYEVKVDNEEHITGIIKELGFKKDQRVVKKRVSAKVGEYEICIDEIEKLGLYIELEKIVDDEVDGVAIQKTMEEFLSDMLGSSVYLEQTDLGYDILMKELLVK